jgi:hypothetical protein
MKQQKEQHTIIPEEEILAADFGALTLTITAG